MRGFRREDPELRRLEADLRARRSEAPSDLIDRLVGRRRERSWERPRLQLGLVVGVVGLALAAMASAGGFSVLGRSTTTAVHTITRVANTSSPRVVRESPADAQYKKHCGGTSPTGVTKCHIVINDASVLEGNSARTRMTFTVSLDASPDATVTAQFATSSGSAIGGSSCAGANTGSPDYISTSGQLTFAVGVKTQKINVAVCGDTKPEPNESFQVDLSNPSANAVINRTPGIGTIVNDD
jgi:hypothetical protein